MSDALTPARAARTYAEPLGTYPERYTYDTRYGVSVWLLGEDCERGWMVAGHGRRAYAALNAEARECERWWLREQVIERLWVLFYLAGGHTWRYEAVPAGTEAALPVLRVVVRGE